MSDELKRQYVDSLHVLVVASAGTDERELLDYLSERGIVTSNDATLDALVRQMGRPLRTRTPVLLVVSAHMAIAKQVNADWLSGYRHLERLHFGTRGHCHFNGLELAALAQDLRDPLGTASQLLAFLGQTPPAKVALLRAPLRQWSIQRAIKSLGILQDAGDRRLASLLSRLPEWIAGVDWRRGESDTTASRLDDDSAVAATLKARYEELNSALFALPRFHVLTPDGVGAKPLRGLLLASRHLADRPERVRAVLLERFCPVPHLVDRAIGPWDRLGSITPSQVRAAAASPAGEGCFVVQHIAGRLFTMPKHCTDVANFPCYLFRQRRRHLLNLLRAVIEASPLPDFEAAFCLGDCVVSEAANATSRHLGSPYKFQAGPLPAFVITGCSSSANIRFPMWDHFAPTDAVWREKIAAMERVAAKHPWETRRDQAIFRGGQRTCTKVSPPGASLKSIQPPATVEPCYLAKPGDSYAEHCGRTGLLHKALSSPLRKKFNVSLTSGYHFKEWYKQYGPPDTPTYVPFLEMGHFKFIIHVEGHCHFANRLRSLLFLDAVILKQEVECGEFYDDALRPWVHYVPISYTFSNLTQAMQWALSHPAELRTIRRNARKYARSILMPRHVVAYAQQLLQRYAALLHYKVRLDPQAAAVQKNEQLTFEPPGAYRKTVGPCRRPDGNFDKALATCGRARNMNECYGRCETSGSCGAFDWAGNRKEGVNCCHFRTGNAYRGVPELDRQVSCYLRPKS